MNFTGERFVPSAVDDIELEIEHLQRYLSVADMVRDKVVLDAASGEGYGSFILSEKAAKVTGIDLSKDAVEHAREAYKRFNLTFECASIEKLPFEDSSFDIVVSFETIEHVDEMIQKSFLNEIKRVLKKGGLLIMSTPNKYIYSDRANYKNEFHVKEFYEEEFRGFLRNYFRFIDMYYQNHEVYSVINNGIDEGAKAFYRTKQENSSGKYMIAICSDQELKQTTSINSIYLDGKERFFHAKQRILQLQDEVEERNAHIKNLDEFIESKDRLIRGFQDEVKSKNEELILKYVKIEEFCTWAKSLEEDLRNKNKVIEDKEELIKGLIEDVKSKEVEIDRLQRDFTEKVTSFDEKGKEKDQIINNQLGHIEQLLEQERILNANQKGHIEQLLQQERILDNIYTSEGWKLLLKLYKFRDGIFPKNSKRKLFAKILFNAFKNPKRFASYINKNNIKKFRYYLKTDSTAMLENRIDNYVERNSSNTDSMKELQIIEQTDHYEKLIFKKELNPLVSIVIPVYNQWNFTYSCLRSIIENTLDIPYEIIIADDVSTDETVNIANYVENITVIRDQVNRGFLLNCNNAAKHANGKYILFLNNDTNVQPDWLKHLVDLIERDETIGMVGSKLVYSDGRLQEAGGIIWNDASGWNYGRLDDPEKPEYNYVKEVDYISGACIMIRSGLWRDLGGFDDRYVPAYFEDSDLAFGVRKHGYKVVLQPKSVVVHFEGISHGTDVNSGVKSYQVKNREKFIEKWKDVLEAEHFENAKDVYLARDRSKNKKTILVIDHYVPHFDKDAGSRTTYQYLKMFVDMGLNVKFIGDNFYKHEPYTSDLQQLGVEVLYGNWYASNMRTWLKENGKYINYTYLNRPHISIKYIDLIREYTPSKILYYGHDLHYLRELREYELYRNKESLKASNQWKAIEWELFRKSDVVYYPSQVEIDHIEQELPNVVGRAIPAYIYENEKNDVKPIEKRRDLVFVGGFGHKPNTDAVLWFTNDILPIVKEQIPDIKFYIVGSNPPDVIKELESEDIIITGFVSDDQLEELYNNCKIDVVPLRYGAGVKGKVVEALYHRIPIITTSVGAEGLPNIEDYLVIADNPIEFANQIVKVYTDDSILVRLSQGSKEYVKKYFSPESVLSIIEKDINR
ncbi:glycosyltransferase [Ammoniphilus resinae]|uniref:GT2 family glycosyltransferase/ubiquinone/menaquinone biosynthesis C-methylase UbiE n=1 Tax=Ammoniphilus resinae TaxID=861532 RepID=A0ABS4GWX0_9BACL|nr:glycosyltransferase [Ammoniphilus resinae]MBP1934764.1 GT2 family glycosyltransferase/ubiquinone/menaquinone biosynthesis C-methylase UbiE [Ammoniphilus resinae]